MRVLILQECHFGGFESFAASSYLFPGVKTCAFLTSPRFKSSQLGFRGLSVYDLAPTHLEITITFTPEWVEFWYALVESHQSEVVRKHDRGPGHSVGSSVETYLLLRVESWEERIPQLLR